MKRCHLFVLLAIFMLCVFSCKEPADPEGDWFDMAILNITDNVYNSLINEYDVRTVYSGTKAKQIFESSLSGYILGNSAAETKITYEEVTYLLNELLLPIELAKKAVGDFTAYIYIGGDDSKRLVAFVEDVSKAYSKNVMAEQNILEYFADLHPELLIQQDDFSLQKYKKAE